MNTEIYGELLTKCREYIDKCDEKNSDNEVHLNDDPDHLKRVERNKKGQKNIFLISDTQKFRTFLKVNGAKKMYLDINMGHENVITLAEELKLDQQFGQITFISRLRPSDADMERIKKLGAKFMDKTDHLAKMNQAKGA